MSLPLPAAISPSSQAPTFGSAASAVAAVGDHIVDVAQVGAVVVAQALRLVVNDGLELRHLVCDRQQLVDLLLVLRRCEFHLGVGQHVGELIRHRVGIDRHRNRAERLRRHDRGIDFRPVGADDRDGVAAPHAEAVETHRIGAHLVEQPRPAPGLPNAQILVAQRWPVGEQLRVTQQQLRKGIRLHLRARMAFGAGLGCHRVLRWPRWSRRAACSPSRCPPASSSSIRIDRRRRVKPWHSRVVRQWPDRPRGALC